MPELPNGYLFMPFCLVRNNKINIMKNENSVPKGFKIVL